MGTEAPSVLLALLQIVGVNVILSGDNAVVIALACRSLPPAQQRLGIVLGTIPAIVLRVVFALFVVYLLEMPWLKLVGSALLFWIGVRLVLPESDAPTPGVRAGRGLLDAVRTVVIADAVMSLDNVLGIAAAAHGDMLLLVIGLVISMPLVIWGSTLILRLLQRFPVVVTLGGALIGWIAGDVGITDPALHGWVTDSAPALHAAVPLAGAVFVVAAGHVLARRARRAEARSEAEENRT